MLHLGSQMQIHLQKSTETCKRDAWIILTAMLFDSRHFSVKREQWAELLRSLPAITPLPVQFWEAPGCLILLSLCCRHRLRGCSGRCKCSVVWSSLTTCPASLYWFHGTSSPGQPVTCSPEQHSAQKIAFSKDWLVLFRVVILHVKVTSGVAFENCTCS